MATVITVFSGSGGAGKSLVACNIACGLTTYGKRVLITEVSFNQRADDIILGITPDTVYGFSDICSRNCKPGAAVIRSEDDFHPDFIASVPGDAQDRVKDGIASLLKSQSGFYDYIIFDLSYSFDDIFDAAVKMSDIAIGVTTDITVSVRNTAFCMNRARDFGCRKLYTILNGVCIDNSESSVCVEDIADELGEALIGIIPFDEHIKTSVSKSDPIIRYNTYAGRSLENICKRIMGIPVPEYETGIAAGLFSKNKLVLK